MKFSKNDVFFYLGGVMDSATADSFEEAAFADPVILDELLRLDPTGRSRISRVYRHIQRNAKVSFEERLARISDDKLLKLLKKSSDDAELPQLDGNDAGSTFREELLSGALSAGKEREQANTNNDSHEQEFVLSNDTQVWAGDETEISQRSGEGWAVLTEEDDKTICVEIGGAFESTDDAKIEVEVNGSPVVVTRDPDEPSVFTLPLGWQMEAKFKITVHFEKSSVVFHLNVP